MSIKKDNLKRLVIADMGDPETDSQWNLRLIHPHDAIAWVASGRLYSPPPVPAVQPWHCFMDGYGDWKFEREAGKLDLATEFVADAVSSGKLRFFFVNRSLHQRQFREDIILPKLEVISPEEIEGASVSFSSDDGYAIFLSWPGKGEDEDGEYVNLEDFFFLWDEVKTLRPGGHTEHDQEELDEIANPAQQPWSVIERSAPDPALSQVSRRGRKPRHYGGPIARFLARAVSGGLETAAEEKDETLGRWLLEEFAKQGEQKLPDLRNASSDARGALNAWMAAMAQNDGLNAPLAQS